MAITVSTLTEGNDSGDKTSYDTASISPAANRLLLLAVVSGHTGGGQEAPSSVTGNGLTWVQVGTVAASTGNQRVSVYRAMGSGPSAGAVTINFANAQHRCLWSVFELAGVDTSGTNGSGAIAQTPKTGSNSTGSPSVTLDSAISLGNASFGAFTMNAASATATPGSGYTEAGSQAGGSSPSTFRFSEYKLAGSQTVDCTFSQSAKWAVVALEIKALVAGSTVTKDLDLRWGAEAEAQDTWAVTSKLKHAGTSTTADAKDTGTRGFSGLVASKTYPGIFYFQPDHPQPDGRIYAVRLEEGTVGFVTGSTRYKRIDVSGVSSSEDDWEDITIDASGKIYVWGNGGTNKVYRFPEVDPRTSSSLSTTVDDTLDPPDEVGGSQESVGSCETIFWFNSDMYWINKVDPDSSRHKMWKRPAAGGAATYIGPIGVPSGGFGSTGRICGGDVSEDGKRVGIVNKYNLYVYSGTNPTDAVSRPPVWAVDFKDPSHSQEALTEAVAFVPGTYDIYLMNEGTSSGEAWFKYVPAAAYGPGTPGQTTTSVTKSVTLRWGMEQADDAGGTGCMFGAHVEGSGFPEDTWEDTRKTLAIVRTYYQPEDWGTLPDDDDPTFTALEQGRMVMVSWKHGVRAGSGWVGSGNIGWRQIANGDHDVFIDRLMKLYEPYGRRVIFVFNHEPHDDPGKAKDAGLADNDTVDSTAFKQAFRKIAAKARARGLLVGYCATASKALAGSPKGEGDLLYAGNEHIDVECHDHYNWYTFDNRAWQTEPYTGSSSSWFHLDEMAIRRGHPLIFGEWGSHPGDSTHSRKDYFTAAATWIKTRPNIRGFCLYESNHTHNWLTTADELSAFVNDPYFSSTPLYALPEDAPSGSPTTGTQAVGANLELRWSDTGKVGRFVPIRWDIRAQGLINVPNSRGPLGTRIRSSSRNNVELS